MRRLRRLAEGNGSGIGHVIQQGKDVRGGHYQSRKRHEMPIALCARAGMAARACVAAGGRGVHCAA